MLSYQFYSGKEISKKEFFVIIFFLLGLALLEKLSGKIIKLGGCLKLIGVKLLKVFLEMISFGLLDKICIFGSSTSSLFTLL